MSASPPPASLPASGPTVPRSEAPRARPSTVDREEGARSKACCTRRVASPTTATGYDHPDTRPRMRGWLHLFAFFGSIVAAAVLIPLAFALGPRAGWPVTVYCLTILGLFGVSALYHRRRWSPRGWALMKRADHSMIFLFIAGTYTPFALLAVAQPTGWWLLAGVWAAALVGVALKMVWPTPRAGWACRSTWGWAGPPSSCSSTSCDLVGVTVAGAHGGRRAALQRRRDRLRAQAAQPLAGHLRLPRGLPRDDDRGRHLPLHRGATSRSTTPPSSDGGRPAGRVVRRRAGPVVQLHRGAGRPAARPGRRRRGRRR